MRTLILWLLLASTAFAELTVKVESPGPIVATLELPKDGESVVTWTGDAGTRWMRGPSGRVLHVWAHPGEHWLEAEVVTAVYAERDILVPGPNWATDKTDVQLEKLKYLVDKTKETHRQTFVVEGEGPRPPPDPEIPDPTTPTVPKPGPTTPATAATYVYEKDVTAIPSPVAAGLNRLNREKKIVATLFEEDTVDGTGQTPEQYRVPLSAAQSAGLPALVVTAGAAVLKVVKAPTTEAAVLEAVQ
jgi:hypothetical protein